MGKGENAGYQENNYQYFPLFPQCFQKLSFSGSFNPFPNKPWFLRVCSMSLLKTLWEKEKLLVTSNFSFSHSVFYTFWELSAIFIKLKIFICKLFQFGRVQNMSFGKGLKSRLCGKELTVYHTIPTFNNPKERSLKKTLRE